LTSHKPKSRKARKKRGPTEIVMAVLGVGFIVLAALVVLILFTRGCSVVHYPLDIQ